MAEICTRTLSIPASACSRTSEAVVDSHPMAKLEQGLGLNVTPATARSQALALTWELY